MDNNLTKSRRTPYDDAYESCDRTYAELRIYSELVSPDLITKQLCIEPTSIQKRGDTHVNSLGRERVVQIHGWFLSSENTVDSKDLRSHLDWLIGRLERSSKALGEVQIMDGVTMLVNCVWWSRHGMGGPTLWPEHMQKLAALNLECGFEFAFYGDDE